jgi:hypothetical protein
MHWTLNFKTSRIEKYDGSTNPTEWLKVYELPIEAIGGDSYYDRTTLEKKGPSSRIQIG